jgi:orotidine-5'-phosphate decarboxylase
VHDLHGWVSSHGANPENYGVVVGATVDLGALGVEFGGHPDMPILAPGYGAQGGLLGSARADFPGSRHVIPVVARSVLEAGPDGFALAIEEALSEVASA